MVNVYAVNNTILSFLSSLAVLFMGFVSDFTSISGAFCLAALLYRVSALIGFIYKPLRTKQFQEETL
ncbi:hypothetical protein ACOI1C_07560 [Bacillus sp. DJP31]|uniref:hypothetical protein n=1 Tax=Bacillus sp. DJP31 TaxID=3409789 RepID=UPI003BB59E2A